jgi:hypothetical protein
MLPSVCQDEQHIADDDIQGHRSAAHKKRQTRSIRRRMGKAPESGANRQMECVHLRF